MYNIYTIFVSAKKLKKNKTMENLTLQHKRLLNGHIHYTKGSKTVCVSTCLSFFGVMPNQYNYTGSSANRNAYMTVLRRFGYSVRSRNTECKVGKNRTSWTTLTAVKKQLKKKGYSASDFFLILCEQTKAAHLIVVNGLGETIIDTAPNMKWKVSQVSIVEK